ncbi:hypothetical protein FOCC_FOCC014579 [Frankliniella occidentalis]|nr:hypothetical protein FOCC_FOCC014579 [Frankliniella occidentalis]
MLLGDNLGTHIFTGFLENFSSSKYLCRFCEEPRDEWLKRWFGCVVEENGDSDEDDNTDSDENNDLKQ